MTQAPLRERDSMSAQKHQTALIPVEQDSIPFYGHELIAVRLTDGRIAAVLRWLCDSLQIDIDGQLQRIRRKTALAEGLVLVRVDTAGGPQEMQALTLDVLPGYLFTIDERRVKAEAQSDIVLFQRECVKALAEHFEHKRRALPALAAPQSLAPEDSQLAGQVAQIAEQIDMLNGVVSFLQEHMAGLLTLPSQVAGLSEQIGQALTMLESLAARQDTADTQLARIDERTQRLTPAHARAIQEQVDRMTRETKRLAQPLTYAIVYGRLKHRFRASSYREIADEQFEAVMAYLREELHRTLAGEGAEQGSLF